MAFVPKNQKLQSKIYKADNDHATTILKGSVGLITYYNQENGYYVISIEGKDLAQPATVIGYAPSLHLGENIEVQGNWVEHNQHGWQFKAKQSTVTPPTGKDGLISYLSSGVFVGIGDAKARKLVDHFGEEVLNILEGNPLLVQSVISMNNVQAELLGKTLRERKVSEAAFLFLHTYGVSANKAKIIYNTYKEKTVSTISTNPYVLCKDVFGIGFKQADEIAQKLGLDVSDDKRLNAAISYVLKEATNKGSCGVPTAEAITRVQELLRNVSRTLIIDRVREELASEKIISEKVKGIECLFHPTIYKTEKEIAKKILDMVTESKTYWSAKITDDLVNKHATKLKIALSDKQFLAVKSALTNKISVITGGPGTGKSTITKVIVACLEDIGVTYNLCSPTGIAAKRLTDVTRREAKTIHRAIGYNGLGEFEFNKMNPFLESVGFLDESSMVDAFLMRNYIDAIRDNGSLILIGDIDQLPSVGPGLILNDIIKSGAVPTVKLDTVFRQAEQSQIITHAHKINNGEKPPITKGDDLSGDCWVFEMAEKSGLAPVQDRMLQATIRGVKKMETMGYDPVKDVQVLAPMQNGVLGVINLNQELRKHFNPNPDIPWMEFKPGDKVIQTVNNYEKEVFNGEIGYVIGVNGDKKTFNVKFIDGKVITYTQTEKIELSLAYALTIHKSQGSEFPAVLMVIAKQHNMMLKRNLVYTGLTRGRKQAVIISQEGSLDIAVKNNQSEERYSMLLNWLTEDFKPQSVNKKSNDISF